MSILPETGLQLLSCVTSTGTLELSLADCPVVAPKDSQVVVQVQASPINPSDLGLLLGLADISTARSVADGSHPRVEADVPAAILPHLSARFDEAMPVGNEGSGIVVAAGASPEAQALLGKTVGVLGGAMYSQYRTCLLYTSDAADE